MGLASGAARASALFAAASRNLCSAAPAHWAPAVAVLRRSYGLWLHIARCGAHCLVMGRPSPCPPTTSRPTTTAAPLPLAVAHLHRAALRPPTLLTPSLRRRLSCTAAPGSASTQNLCPSAATPSGRPLPQPPSALPFYPSPSPSTGLSWCLSSHSAASPLLGSRHAFGAPPCLLRGFVRPSSPMSASLPAQSDRPLAAPPAAASSAAAPGGAPRHTNRLASEQSPYLLQHAHNPVDWYPWGEEAFQRARAEDKPIFLSVGYATCHWCHVMERESFENDEVAELLNSHFIAVKVDREERPDVDRVYMTYVQAISGSGGWPMSVWLTPALEPFYGGTYYPPKDRFIGTQLAAPGFTTVLRRIASLWRTNRQDLKDKAVTTLAQLTEALQPEQPPGKQGGPAAAPAGPAASPSSTEDQSAGVAGLSPQLAAAAVDACGHDLARRYDAEYGGFGGAPKFPRPSEINLLLRAQMRQMEQGDLLGSRRLRDMALASLRAMAAGGMYDHLGGGFHRYSVDELWHVPHFEKMLYDNPQLAATYLAAFQLTGDAHFAGVARGVLDYLLRDMTSPAGGLYSAEDADSIDPHTRPTAAAPPPPAAAAASSAVVAGDSSCGSGVSAAGFSGEPRQASEAGLAGVGMGTAAEGGQGGGERKEGAFYVWDHSEIMAVLGPELGSFFCLVYGIDDEGNCNRSGRSDPHGEFEGKNVPYFAVQPEVAAARLGLPYAGDAAEAARRLAGAREALHAARAARPRPSLDDKIVTGWNGMGIGAFAIASRVLAAEEQVERLFPSEGRPASAYLQAAQRTAAFVREQLWTPPGRGQGAGGGGRLRRSFCRGPSAVAGFADDYAALISGLLDLFECGGGREWLEWALQLQAVQDQLFWDPQSGGYYSTADPASPDADPSIRIRIKDDYDGAEPTASSVAAANLLRLADMVPVRPQEDAGAGGAAALSYDEAARLTLAAFTSRLTQAPLAVPQMCCAAHTLSRRPLRQVIVAGPAGAADTGALLDAVHSSYCPDKVVLVMDPTDPRDVAFWRQRNPPAAAMVEAHFARRGAQQEQQVPPPATAFICQNFTCQAPTSDPVRVRELLARQQVPPSAAQLKHFDFNL